MHLYRPRPQLSLVMTNNFYQGQSYFIYCNKLLGYRGIADNSCICLQCYRKIRVPLIQAQFEPVKSHFVSCGLDYLLKYCINCEALIVNQRPLKECDLCINRFFHFKFISEELERPLDSYENPIILLIKGRYC